MMKVGITAWCRRCWWKWIDDVFQDATVPFKQLTRMQKIRFYYRHKRANPFCKQRKLNFEFRYPER